MYRRLLLTLALAALLVPFAPAPHAAAQQQTDAAQAVIAGLNAWRMSLGLTPLKPNPTLEALALLQADYLISLPDLPDNLHAGRTGESVRDRAQWAPYNWPGYGRPDQVAVEEIAQIGPSPDYAIEWWRGSSVHTRAVTNPGYREVGVAALPHTFGYLFIVVLGSEPGILPALADPTGTQLFLTNEQYAYAAGGAWIHTATEVRLFDAAGRPLDDWVPWQAAIPVPEGAGERVYVLYSDGATLALSAVDLTQDVILLPGGQTPPATQAPESVSIPPTFTPAPGATLAPAAGEAGVLLVYDDRSLTIVNTSGAPLDVTGLSLVGGAVTLPATRWRTDWLPFLLEAMPAGACLQVWGWSEPVDLPAPAECGSYHSTVAVDPAQRFWASGSFEAQWQGEVVATCAAGAGRCAVVVPAPGQ